MWLFGKKTLKQHLRETKKIKLKGVIFEIKKISTLDHVRGAQVIQSMYETYSLKKDQKHNYDADFKKLKKIYTDIIESGVVKPQLSRTDDSEKVCIEEIFLDWNLAENLVNEIMQFTYGKKKALS